MVNLSSEILFNIFMPVLLLSCCSGILLIGTLIYLSVYIIERKRLFLTILTMGILGFIFSTSEVLVIVFSVLQNPDTALIFHRTEALSALFFSFALPMFLSDILELGKSFRKFNSILSGTMLILSFIILIISLLSPELFISSAKPYGAINTPWNFGRGTPGILYRIRDILIFFSTLYTFIFITLDIFLNKRVRYLGLILTGIIIGIISGLIDLIAGIIEIDNGLFSSRIHSYFGFGFTIFIMLSMISIFRWFLDQARDISNSKKIESLGLFAGGIAHDFNNILTGIMGNTSLLKNDLSPGNIYTDILSDIEKAIYRAKNLTTQLLTFSRGGSPVKDITSIKNIIEETAKFVLTGSGIKSRITADENLLNVNVDAGQISQVIQNIVLNARDAMADKGGYIDIKMENIKMNKPSGRRRHMSDFIKIEIKDYGTGIKDHILPNIFDPYFTTKSSGTGLGLSLSYSIIRKHGGDISVKSKYEEGTSFIITLPATSETKIVEPVAYKSGIPFNGRILVMDDDPYLRPMIKKMLEHIGLTSLCVPDGESAVAEFLSAKITEKPFNAVIMDLTISGGMGGVKALQKVREIDPSIPIVVASGYSEDPVMSDYKSYGFNEKLIKPFTLEDLRRAIFTIIIHDTENS